jgi:putative holliday junction resolvase
VRSLGLDVGGRRTGVALSDALGVTCRPLEVIEEPDRERLIQRVFEVAGIHQADEVVVGLPRPLAGGSNPQLESVRAFVAVLEVRSGMPVKTWDERFTSKLAGKPGAKSGARDSVAACYMLQNYLDAQANARGEL